MSDDDAYLTKLNINLLPYSDESGFKFELEFRRYVDDEKDFYIKQGSHIIRVAAEDWLPLRTAIDRAVARVFDPNGL